VTLRIVQGAHEGEERRFKSAGKLIVGRGKEAHWCLAKDKYFSRAHFELNANPPKCLLRDLGSANGTYVNGTRVDEADLGDGDHIECGDTVIHVSVLLGPVQADTPTLQVPPDQQIDPSSGNAPSNALPRRLAEYELLQELGRGGMGVVYRALELPSRRTVAVKVIRPEGYASPNAMQLFIREASILSQLKHKRIVDCRGLGIDAGEMYFAMEYVPTVDFFEYTASSSRTMQIRTACAIVCEVLEALQCAHEMDIVHRDVKPSNMLIYKSYGGVATKLSDFGLAKNYVNAGFTIISHDHPIRYTPGFASPEQMADSRFAKPPCDIYSTGVCLYYFLCKTLPSEPDGDEDDGGSFYARPLIKRAPDVPQELAIAVDRAIAFEPSGRFSSAEHMRQALLKFARR